MDQVLSAVTTHHVCANPRSYRVPGLPEHIVGFNRHLEELKCRLLNYDTQVLISGPVGCGKTTLAKLLCHDNEIKVGASLCRQPVLKWKTTLKKWSESRSILQSNTSMLLSPQSTVDALDELPNVKDYPPLGMYTSENLLELSFRNHINLVPLRKDANEVFTSVWYDLKAPKVEVLTLNIRSKSYTLAEFINRMGQMKMISITSYNDYPSQLHNLSFMDCLSTLRTIRFEHLSFSRIQYIFALMNLRKLSFVMCEIGNALMSCITDSLPYTLSNITDLEIDMCYDLKELPSLLLAPSPITNCQELDVLPKGLGSLSNLEILRLHCCTKLQELPVSIGSLCNLSFIDISDCLCVSLLPEEIGELCCLKVLKMDGCSGLQELPLSIRCL
ncbi:hypothetical protein L1987_74585 [Smallanthus sonchifolius]|uniref:Uncharacterized protein n=1 Tax=Smallanthus sonchifolius TaxID=185202 RepID=A0ACB9A3G2_9ASTR|nr:hypothetical protein L1987_74585 [Smallanthus sonchifolius]